MDKLNITTIGAGIVGVIAFLAILCGLACLNEWTIDTWLKWAESTRDFPLFGGFILCLLGPVMVTLAIITFVINFFI
jgi:hypothetical protein